MRERLLEHFLERDVPIDMLILHCSRESGEDIVRTLDANGMSSHYVLDEKGELIRCVDEAKSAQHAFPGFWRGSDHSPNTRSIGIEISSPSMGQDAYSEAQIQKLIPFCHKIIRKYNIPVTNVVGHSDISPTRKPDPGMAFPWKRLAKEGIGLWYQPRNACKVPSNNVRELLAMIGYDTRSEDVVKASAYAFCRHFLPQCVERDDDIEHLLNHVLPDNFDFMREEKFVQTLKAVAYSYAKAGLDLEAV